MIESKSEIKSINRLIGEYTKLLQDGEIQSAYKSIMTFMSGLKKYLEDKHPEYDSSRLYLGYMDMTYFAFTPLALKEEGLKVAIVYLHKENRFDVWLAGTNRSIQAHYIELIRHIELGDYRLSQVSPGVDSIIEQKMVEQPDFEHGEDLKQILESNILAFSKDLVSLLK